MKPTIRSWPVMGLAVLALLAGACAGSHETPDADSGPVTDVRTARVAVAAIPTPLEAGGVVRARSAATLVARIMAPVREVRVRPGDRVRAGQTLVVLDDRDLSAHARQAASAGTAAEQAARAALSERDAARAGLALAKSSHGRVAGLLARKSATPQEMDEATAALRTAEAHLAAAEAHVLQADAGLSSARAAGDAASITAGFAAITSPFDGIVTEKLVDPGTMAAPGMPLVRVEDNTAFRLEVRVDESRARFVRPGADVPVVLDTTPGAPATEMTGRVAEVAQAVDADARASLVKIDVPGTEGVRSGTYGRVRFPGPERRALLVPREAIRRNGQVTSVFVVADGRARLRLISTGASGAPLVEVLAGLGEGELVVVSPTPALSDGQRVRAVGGGAPRTQGAAR